MLPNRTLRFLHSSISSTSIINCLFKSYTANAFIVRKAHGTRIGLIIDMVSDKKKKKKLWQEVKWYERCISIIILFMKHYHYRSTTTMQKSGMWSSLCSKINKEEAKKEQKTSKKGSNVTNVKCFLLPTVEKLISPYQFKIKKNYNVTRNQEQNVTLQTFLQSSLLFGEENTWRQWN